MIGPRPAIHRADRASWKLVLLIAALFCAGSPCHAQPGVTTASLFEAAHQEGLGRWIDAIEIYQRVLETGGDELVPADRPIAPLAHLAGGPVWAIPWPSYHSRAARWICHERISGFPAEALKSYRDRVDVAAAKRLQEAGKRTDDILLEQILSDWYCSRAGEDAIRLLGERAFERADLDAAERWWNMLLPREPESFSSLRYPDPVSPVAGVRARLLLVKLFRGERETVRRELAAYRAAYPAATGLLAGKEGKYADTLAALLADPRQVTLADNAADAKTWPTFAGHPDRNTLITSGLPRYWPGPPAWRTAIPSEATGRDDAPGAPDHPRAAAFHPVIAGVKAFIADAARVFSFDLATGERTTLLDLRKRLPLTGINLQFPTKIDTRYTLAFADGYLYARLGSQPLRTLNAEVDRAAASAIVCFGPIAARATEMPALLWIMQPGDAQSIFEGTPLLHGDRLYALTWRFGGGDPVRLVTCYRGLGRKEPPEVVWEREIGRVSPPPTNEPTVRHELLTLAGNNVVFGSNAGSIVALDKRTGKPAWEYRYTTSERRPPPVGRDLTPCLFDGLRVFAAPTDSDRLFCLDAFTGRLLWDREGVDVVHLLGVTHGRLIATFAGPVKGIRGLSATTGTVARPDGWIQHLEGGSTSFGRGLVTPDLIFWPTRQGLYFLDPEDGSPIRQPVEGAFGNLAYADGCLVATTATEVLGFISDGKLLEPRKVQPEKKTGTIIIYRQKRGEVEAARIADVTVRLKCDRLVDFPTAAWQPLSPIPSRMEETSDRDPIWFTSARIENNDRRFQQFRCTHEIDCGLAWNDKLVLAGANGVSRFKRSDTDPIWSWQPADHSKPSLARDVPGIHSGRLSGWHRDGDRLYAILNDSQLLAIDANTGSIVWQHRADEVGQTIPPVSIRPHFFAGRRRLLIQLSSGRLRIVDAADGRSAGEFDSPRAPWTADPIWLSHNDQRVVFPEDAETLSCFDLDAGKFVWRMAVERKSSLTGSLPALRVLDDVLLAEVDRDIGVEIDAFEPRDGRRLWKTPIFVGARRGALGDCDGECKQIYVPGESEIIAVSTVNGERLWQAPLPEPRAREWRIRCAAKHLIAHPVEPIPIGNAEGEWRRAQQGWPTLPRLARLAQKSYDAYMERTLPIALLDRSDGRVVQRLVVPAQGPACSVRLDADSKLTVVTGSGVWHLR